MSRNLKLAVCLGIPLLVLLMPARWLPIEGLSAVEHRLIAIFFMATLCWLLEPIPIYATSVLIIVAELLMVSDKAFILFRPGPGAQAYGTALGHREIMAAFASPIIMLFLGGFFLAAAATKYQLDLNLARIVLRPFGSRPRMVILGLMLVTAFFSMFMSNTATTAMMLAVLSPVLKGMDVSDRGRIAFTLAVPVAANLGGIGTPIGTPPNAIALKYLTGADTIGFGTWMSFAVPFVLVMLAFAWRLLVRLFPPETPRIAVEIPGRFRRSRPAAVVYATFILAVLLWMTDFLHGMNASVVALIPVAVFSATGIINRNDLKKLNWDILWLMAGGIALGMGLEESGLARHVVEALPLSGWAPAGVVLAAAALTLLMANIMSHTATANLLLPLFMTAGAALPGLDNLGGTRTLILAATFAASLGMSLPISTPPNAIAHGTGAVETRHLLKTGSIIGLAGLAGVFGMLSVLRAVGFL